MNRRSKIWLSLSLTICLAAAYVFGYFQFRHMHGGLATSSSTPFTEISTSPADTALMVLFYPALCLDARFGPDRIFLRVKPDGDSIPGHQIYPFSEVTMYAIPYDSATSKPIQ